MTNDNYDNTWELLTRRYGRRNLVVNSLMKQMTALKPCGDQDTKSLRALLDKVSSSIGALEALDVPLESYGALLAPLIRQKMPHKLNLMLSRKLADSRKGDDFIDITAISDFLETELSARESVEMTSMTSSLSFSGSSSDKPSGSGKSQGHRSDHKGKSKSRRGRATGLALVGTRAPICGFCQGSHWSDHCQKVKGLSREKIIVQKTSSVTSA